MLIAGGGLAGSLAALALARLRPDVPVLLVEEKERIGESGLWPLFEADVPPEARELLAPLIARSWEGYYLAFPGHARKLRAPIHAIDGAALDAEVRRALGGDAVRTGTKAVAVRDDALFLEGGETVKAEGAIDARGPANLAMLEPLYLRWQRFDLAFDAPHGVDRPVLADATMNAGEGLSFFRCLPLGEDRLAVWDAVLAASPGPPEQGGERIGAYAGRRGWRGARTESGAEGAWPLPTGGDFGAFWRTGGARVAKLGTRGGFFHPFTGWTAADAVRTALKLAAEPDLAGAALHDSFEAEAKRLWKERAPIRELNAALARAGPGAQRTLFERIHRMEPGLLARFLGARLGLLDQRRLEREARG